MRRTLRRFSRPAILAATAVVLLLAMAALHRLDHAFPPPLPADFPISTEVLDRDDNLLRAFATPDGRWRLAVNLDQVDPRFVEMLIAYEDRRFYSHSGVDPVAIGRAVLQFARNGRIVSGGSTITMQLARLLEPREARSLRAKLRQILRAWQMERRLSKREILEAYLTHAPYGGNIEGIRAASLAWYGKEPLRLTIAEAALLVALPQLPERRRPDRNPGIASAARERVMQRLASAGLLDPADVDRATVEPVPSRRLALPALAAHLADHAVRTDPAAASHRLTIRRASQQRLEAVALQAADRLGPGISVAILLCDARTGAILASVGSPSYFNAGRSGSLDMTKAIRSPGSTLKPFIYGLAFEEGLVAQETLIEDRPANFAGYRPRNFDMDYQGDVSIRQALQSSLNVPAIRLLDAVGPTRLAARLRRAGVRPVLPRGAIPSLAIGLGGVGLSLRDLVQLYAGLANHGRVQPLRDRREAKPPDGPGALLLDPRANWQVVDILSGVKPPQGTTPLGIAYKTGTSYGYRDAWAIGFDGRHTLGVWVGRPDSGSQPGLSGYASAAPLLFEAFARAGVATVPLPRPPAGSFRTPRTDLPVTLERFTPGPSVRTAISEPPPLIVHPPQGAHVDLGASAGEAVPLVLKIQGGRAPFRWLANGTPLPGAERRHSATWHPDGIGYTTLTVIDAAGRAASVRIFVE